MRIVLHAGLHKSGTTSVQDAWRRSYGDHEHSWYPPPPPGPPGHHRLARPLLAAFVDGLAPDLLGASVAFALQGDRGRESLTDLVATARRRGVDTLVLSSEDFARVRAEDAGRLGAALDGPELLLALTVTRPVHRWCAVWQTLVRRGMPHYPAQGAEHVRDLAALRSGRVAEVIDLIPAERCLIRLVRTSPPEPHLAADLAVALGLPPVERDVETRVLNPSLGVDTEVVLRINRADLGMGSDRAGRQALRRLRGDGFAYRDAPELTSLYEIPAPVLEAAAAEQEWLRGLSDEDHTVLDPYGLLDTWTDATVPDWYATISRREAIVPELDDVADSHTLLWRARQERLAYRKRVERRSAAKPDERG